MAITKKLSDLVAKIVKNGEGLNVLCLEAGALAVRQVYANQDTEGVLTLLNTTQQTLRMRFAAYFSDLGVAVVKPAYGSSDYTIGKLVEGKTVLVTGKQQKVFERLNKGEVKDIVVQEIKVRSEPKKKAITGAVKDRINKAMGKAIAALKKTDEEAGAALNDMWSSRPDVTPDEHALLMAYLHELRNPKAARKVA